MSDIEAAFEEHFRYALFQQQGHKLYDPTDR